MSFSAFHSDTWTRMNDHDEAFSSEDEMSFNVSAEEFVPSFNVNAEEFVSDSAFTKIERSDLSSKSFSGRQKLAQVLIKNSTFERAVQEAKRLGYVCIVEVPSKQGPGQSYYLKRGGREETLRCALSNQGKNFCKNRTTYVLKGQDASAHLAKEDDPSENLNGIPFDAILVL